MLYICCSPNTNTIYISPRHSVNPLPRLFGLPPLTFIIYSPFISYIVTATIYVKIWEIPVLFRRAQ